MRRILLICLLLTLNFLPTTAQEEFHQFALGVHLLMDSNGVTPFPRQGWEEYLRYTRQMTGEGGWVVQLIQSDDLDVEKWQRFLDDCFKLGLRPVLRLATYPDPIGGYWAAPPPGANGDYAEIATQWAAFFSQLQLDYPMWIVVGNEPNSGGEWGGRADPEAYAYYFVAVAERLLALNQPLHVAMAGLDLYAPHTNNQPFPGSGITFMDAPAFLDGIFAAEPDILSYADFWASHAYPMGAFNRPPWEQAYQFDRINGAENLPLVEPPPNLYNRGVNGYRWEHWYIEQVIGKPFPPVLITEFGYRHTDPIEPTASDSGGAMLDSQTAAKYLELAIFGNDGRYADVPSESWMPLANDPLVMGVVLFGLAGKPQQWGHTNLLLVDHDGHVRGTYPTYEVLVERLNAAQ